MKVNLCLGDPQFINGYLNICPIAPINHPQFIQTHLDNLDNLVDDGECSEIRAFDVIDFYPFQNLNDLLDSWIRKLKHGGNLILSNFDSTLMCKAIVNREINYQDVNTIFYGHSNLPKKSCHTINVLADILQHKFLKIMRKNVYNYRFVLIGQRQ